MYGILSRVGKDLWDVVGGDNTNAPEAGEASENDVKEWVKKNGKAEFILKRSISDSLYDHIVNCKSASEIWHTLDKIMNKEEGRLQLLENEVANANQGTLSISEFFLKVKNLCSEINMIDLDDPISEARMKRNIIRGLKAEYSPFVSFIQGWAQQPPLDEFESLLSTLESLIWPNRWVVFLFKMMKELPCLLIRRRIVVGLRTIRKIFESSKARLAS